MKTIDKYILERLNPRHLGSTDKFPVDGDGYKIIKFLKRSGFKEVVVKDYDKWEDIISRMNEAKSRVFINTLGVSARGENIIRIADTSKNKISTYNNPIYTVHAYTDPKYTKEFCLESDHILYRKRVSDFDFLKEINKRFDWK